MDPNTQPPNTSPVIDAGLPSFVPNDIPAVTSDEKGRRKARLRELLQKTLKIGPLVVGPMILAISMIYSVKLVTAPSGTYDVRSQAASAETVNTGGYDTWKKTAWDQVLANVPSNPATVSATITVGGKDQLIATGGSYDANKVIFKWNEGEPREPGTKITGYYVYFGENNKEIPFPTEGYEKSVNPVMQGKFTQETAFAFDNLEKGKTYYLYIESVTDSQKFENRYGLEILGENETLFARHLFSYTYINK